MCVARRRRCLGRDSWRHPSLFAVLADWGYPLSEVEPLVLDPTGSTSTSATDSASDDDAETHPTAADSTAVDTTTSRP